MTLDKADCFETVSISRSRTRGVPSVRFDNTTVARASNSLQKYFAKKFPGAFSGQGREHCVPGVRSYNRQGLNHQEFERSQEANRKP
jgi:hypothetical protein